MATATTKTRPGQQATYRCSICDRLWDMRLVRSEHEGCAIRWADGSVERSHPVREGREG